MDSNQVIQESGWDTSPQFGPSKAKILDFNPIWLNSLLVQMEEDLSKLYAMNKSIDPSYKHLPPTGLVLAVASNNNFQWIISHPRKLSFQSWFQTSLASKENIAAFAVWFLWLFSFCL
ncbi:uncharacterized protein MELLADRAFT_114482 [Melampsora larici-populina 98AG31]|uniref:Uncharacterized protein n=1 Tax=Melampsora larici-populina (strain 98AG31 / pathotype 3-4-7) TaxID=747676 RepID=F4SDM4_MELLP|nr:uncharacterized protein MELLADRAFT_114482 [Melampsora larici-populina 98AG31]EGF97252.1 hypothetical protein MELLADRAFT_114482 [Melampsora larici-populina 98AG31]